MLNTLTISLVFLICITTTHIYGQQRCATEERNAALMKISHDHEKFDQWIQHKIKEKKLKSSPFRTHGDEDIYQVPIVVHVIHNGEPLGTASNISESQVLSQIAVLNEDFRRTNVDAINTPEVFQPVAADVQIEFVLAQRTPFGGPTNGIVRVYSPKTTWHYFNDEEELKSLSYWPAEDYINVWVVNRLSSNYIAYSTYPVINLPGITEPNYNRLVDGVVIGRRYFGSNDKGNFDLDDTYDRGRSLTHELGHYFGLRHIWGDGGCGADDFCDDTPLAETSYSSCPPGSDFSCNSQDMYQNFMDYTPDQCMNLFTLCQKERMRIVMENSPRRFSLLSSLGGVAPDGLNLDLALVSIDQPGIISCQNLNVPEVTLMNTGSQVINQFWLNYQINNLVNKTLFFEELNLQPQESFQVILDAISLPDGQYQINVNIVEVNGTSDYNLSNNSLSKVFLVNKDSDFIPMVERFHYSRIWPNGTWSVINEDAKDTWNLQLANNGSTNNYSVSMKSFQYNNIGEQDWLVSPSLDFSNTSSAGMWFKFAYAYRQNRNDKLTILASTDCGQSFPFILFEKSGSMLSAEFSSVEYQPAGSDDWRNEYVDLSEIAGENNVRIAFRWTNGNGNNFFLDDIEFFETEASMPIVSTLNDFKIFPNPASPGNVQIALRFYQRQDIEVTVVDAIGRSVKTFFYQDALNQILDIPFPDVPSGIYILWVKGQGVNKARRLLIK